MSAEPSPHDARVDAAAAALQRHLEGELERLAQAATDAIFTEMPSYAAAPGRLRDSVAAHVLAHFSALVDGFRERRAVTAEDLLFVRSYTAKRVRQVAIADYVHAFQTGQRVLWEAALAFARDDPSRTAVLAFASYLPRYFELATTLAAEVYLEAEQQLAASGERARRDLLDTLLAGHRVTAGPEQDAAQAAGLDGDARCVVLVALPVPGPVEEHELRGAAVSLARATGGLRPPLTVLRHEEIVLVASVAEEEPGRIEARLAAAQGRLADGGLRLSSGVSTVVEGIGQIRHAYREALLARTSLHAAPGLVVLGGMSALEYLTLNPDATASRLLAPAVRRFVAEDLDSGGTLLRTLHAYVAADLNARVAAETLHVHVNTTHYRLGRIAERTGCELRNIPDLIEILIAERMARGEQAEPRPA